MNFDFELVQNPAERHDVFSWTVKHATHRAIIQFRVGRVEHPEMFSGLEARFSALKDNATIDIDLGDTKLKISKTSISILKIDGDSYFISQKKSETIPVVLRDLVSEIEKSINLYKGAEAVVEKPVTYIPEKEEAYITDED